MFLEKADIVGLHTFTDQQNQFGVERYPQKSLLKKFLKGQCLNCVPRVCTTKKQAYMITA